MCGINGFNFKDEGLINKMIDATSHRGPDQRGIYLDPDFSLGHARLSIIDVSQNGRQPIFNEDKTLAIIFNGEIYNFKELKDNLLRKGHRFSSNTDTEVIVHLWEEEREDCIRRLNGIFAFAILEIPSGKLFLVRDRIGVKPLYYYFDTSSSSGQAKLIFSSEIKGILAHPIKREVNLGSLNHYFRMEYTPSPLTMFKGISKLEPGHYLVLRQNKIEIKKYWDLADSEEIKSQDEILEKIRFLMAQSVKGQLISDRPVGIFLSGGIDSTSVLGQASRFLSGKIKTFSAGFDIEPEKFNRDFTLARETAKFYGADHHELIITGKEARDNFEKVVYHMDEPVSNPTQIATFLLAKFAKKEVAVALGGDGGDELFGGYPRYWKSRLSSRYQALPFFLRKKILPLFLKKDFSEKLNFPPGAGRYLQFMAAKDGILSQVIRPDIFQRDATHDFFERKFFQNVLSDFEKQFMMVDLKTWLAEESLMRTDKMTMAFGLEERVPILDHQLAELSVKIPSKLKLRGKNSGKWIFKEAVKEFLPPHILAAREKRGWFSPAAKWLRADLKDFALEVLSEGFCSETKIYFNFPEIRKIFKDHIEKRQYNLDIIWQLMTFQLWYRTFIQK